MLRLLELLGGLSVATDLGTGAPLEESLKRCVVAVRLARTLGRPDDEVRDILYVALLQHLGCTAYSHEIAAVFGDDVSVIRAQFLTNPARPRELLTTFAPMVAEATGRSRARTALTAIASARSLDATAPRATCDVARESARRLGLPGSVAEGLSQMMTSWDGSGSPGVAGEQIPLPTRLLHVASVASIFCLLSGPDRAITEVRRRAGTYLDPSLADLVTHELLADLPDLDGYDVVLALEPRPHLVTADLVGVARVFGDLVDLKSPWLQGHSAAVADLAAAAGERLELDDVPTLRIAGHLHDLGRIGVSSRIWDKAKPLTAAERAQAELHPWHTEQVLSRVPALAAAARIAGQHHECLDGSGYYRAAVAAQLSMPARVLAAADRYRCLVEDRPPAAGLPPEEARATLTAEARAGRLDADAVGAVLEAAGHPSVVRRSWPAGLTERQVDVLRLLARGRSNREIARALVISPRTAEHHVQDIYARIGCSTRAGAALFAMEHGLLDRT